MREERRFAMMAVAVLLAVSFAGSPVTPVDGSQLSAPPTQVVIGVPGELREYHVTIESAAGTPVACGEPVVRDGELIEPVRITEGGKYRIGYHFVPRSGAEQAGITEFTVAAGHYQFAGTCAAPPLEHAHVSDDPASKILTVIAIPLVVSLIFLMLRRPRIRRDRTIGEGP